MTQLEKKGANMIDCLGNEVIPLEEQGEEGIEVADFFEAIANGRKPYGIKSVYVTRNEMYVKTDTIVKENKVGRNDPCPFCKEKGVEIKWKKCKIHNAI